MKTAMATVCLGGGLREKLEAIAKAGFQGVELFENDLLAYSGRPEEVRALCADLGLEIVAYQPFRDLEGLPEPQRRRAFERLERKLDLAAALGAPLILVCSSVSPATLEDEERMVEDLYELGQRAAQRGLRAGYEALSWGRWVRDYRQAWRLVRRAGHPALGLVVDSYHILAPGYEVESLARIPGERIFLVQVADAPLMEMGLLPWSRHYRTFPGQGQLPLEAFYQALAQTGYRGYLSLEVFNDHFRYAPAQEVARDGWRSLRYLQAPQAPGVLVEGLAFVEFALGPEDRPSMEKTLGRMGFSPAPLGPGVEVWQQGRAAILLNNAPQGFAREYWERRGPSVCALGLEVAQTDPVLARAKALGYALQSGDHPWPALAGPEGSLLYLLEPGQAPWTPTPGPAQLEGFDHLAWVLPTGPLLAWLLFFRAVLDLQSTPTVEIPDPSGYIQSQALENPKGSLRLVLNIPQSGGSLASRFLLEHYGGGVQHLALQSRDILATLAYLQEQRAPLLEIPENYYLDLEARWGLEPGLVARLQAHHLLYDAGQGEFLQAYLPTEEGLFFFEVVERKGGYRGYGEANAPIRLAAQARWLHRAS